MILIVTGGEVAIALAARDELQRQGTAARVVSMPCIEWSCEQDRAYRDPGARGHRDGSRAGYYDGIGAARDVIQNHLLQLLALTAMKGRLSFHLAAQRAMKARAKPSP